jgi:hypothetical protein
MSCTLEKRLALILLELTENFGVKDERGARLTVPVRHKDLDDLVGASASARNQISHPIRARSFHNPRRALLIICRERLESFLAQTHPSSNSH